MLLYLHRLRLYRLMKPRQSAFMDQDHQNQQCAPKHILHINFKNMKTWLLFCRTISAFLNECLHILPLWRGSLSSRPQALGWIHFYLFVVWHWLVVQRGESQEEQDPHMKTCQSQGSAKAGKREDKRGTTAAFPTSVWKENTFLSHSLPVCWISRFESGRGDTQIQTQAGTRSRRPVKVVGLKMSLLSYCQMRQKTYSHFVNMQLSMMFLNLLLAVFHIYCWSSHLTLHKSHFFLCRNSLNHWLCFYLIVKRLRHVSICWFWANKLGYAKHGFIRSWWYRLRCGWLQ